MNRTGTKYLKINVKKTQHKKNTKNSQFSDCWVVRLVHIEIEFVSECNVQCASHVSLSCDANEWEYWNILERKCIKFMNAHRTTTTIMYIYYIHRYIHNKIKSRKINLRLITKVGLFVEKVKSKVWFVNILLENRIWTSFLLILFDFLFVAFCNNQIPNSSCQSFEKGCKKAAKNWEMKIKKENLFAKNFIRVMQVFFRRSKASFEYQIFCMKQQNNSSNVSS